MPADNERGAHAPPHVECERHHTSLAVTDVPAAAEFYTGIDYDSHASYRFVEE